MNKYKVGDQVLDLSWGWTVIGRIEDRICTSLGYTYDLNGKFREDYKFPSLLTESEAALLGYFPPKKNVFNAPPYSYVTGSYLYKTEAGAKPDSDRGAVATVPIEFEVDE